MTELQLRLWCLWMCEEFAGLSTFLFDEPFAAAIEGADEDMHMLMTQLVWCRPLHAWELAERMP